MMNAKTQPPTLFEVLGVPPSADKERIRSAYLSLSLRFHPSTVNTESKELRKASEEFFKTIKEAYDILSCPTLHACYLENMRFGSSAALVAVERLRQGQAEAKRTDVLQLYADGGILPPGLSRTSDTLSADSPAARKTVTNNDFVNPNPPPPPQRATSSNILTHPYARPQPPNPSPRAEPIPAMSSTTAPISQHKQMQGELLVGVTLSSSGFYVYVYLGNGQFIRGPDRPTLFLAVSDGARLVRGMENHKIYEVLAVLLEEARQPWSVQAQAASGGRPADGGGVSRETGGATGFQALGEPSRTSDPALYITRSTAVLDSQGVPRQLQQSMNQVNMGRFGQASRNSSGYGAQVGLPPTFGSGQPSFGFNSNGSGAPRSPTRIPNIWETLSVKELVELHGRSVWEFFPLDARRRFFAFAMRFYIPRERPHATQPRSPPEFRGLPRHIFDAYVVMFFRYLKIVNDIESRMSQGEESLERFPTHFPDGTPLDNYLIGEGMNFMRRYGQLYLIRLTIERLSTSDPSYLSSVSQRITAQTGRAPPTWREDPTWTWTETDDLKLLCSLEDHGLGELMESSALVAADSLRWPPTSIENPKFQSFIYSRLQWFLNGLIGVSRVTQSGGGNRS
ncbi:hypothetical protein FOL47_003331 [Perkinsus chesapeaki]|uniref:J domain-containing protein n=1 Tax=Perkinsus chesapeaki TaxID=330153 RepID=A0A7J6M8P6_PERCH|nr:hypothetical protein FOL47_003331 [Perkinsus chesapeaki]